MAFILNKLRHGLTMFPFPTQLRGIFSTPINNLKRIEETQQGNKLIIRGIIEPSPREPYLIHRPNKACPICSLGLDVKHTDVLIISQFLRSDGCMLPRRVTGLCRKQQKKMSALAIMAHKAGLMSSMNPANSKKDPTRRLKWKKFNTYFDESTIRLRVAKPKIIADDNMF